MSVTGLFIRRPVATTLLTLACVLCGVVGYLTLPVADLPNIDFPVIQVQAQEPGGSPEQMASSIAAPLERHLGEIAGLEEMTSQSSTGQVRLTLQFALSRDVNGAARDVEAAIQAARADLPTTLRQNPQYSKANPNDPPALLLALTSDTMPLPQVYDQASSLILPRLSQVRGVGLVQLSGSALPAVRVEIDPQALYKFGIGFEDIRAALASANAHTPKGFIDQDGQRLTLETNDQARDAQAYRDLVIAYRNGRAVRLTDVAQVVDGVEDVRNAGYYNRKPAIVVQVFMQAGGNIVQALDQIHAEMPQLEAALPAAIRMQTFMDRSMTIRASLADTRMTLVLSVMLVVLTVLLFLGTLGVISLLGYSLDNMSLMALTISTGFVVDDAIVVLENVTRHVEKGIPPFEAARRGSSNQGNLFIVLTDKSKRGHPPSTTIGNLNRRSHFMTGARFYALLRSAIRVGARPSNAGVSIYLAGQRHGRAVRLDAEAGHRPVRAAGTGGRVVRRAAGRPGAGCRDRPRHGGPHATDAAIDRQHIV
ncbi:AcrB/AcrD/AcrF family protein [Gluconacetobacter diazotrophicus]|nr:AcrB/AcrD/AcrF family protein [Gluconacetobacter diazotrophicus]